MKDTPINYEVVNRKIKESELPNIGKASIREIKKLIDGIEQDTGEKYIRMEMGIPRRTGWHRSRNCCNEKRSRIKLPGYARYSRIKKRVITFR